MIVQVVIVRSIVKDSLTRYIVTPLMRASCSRGRNLLRHNCHKQERTEVISDNLSQPCYCIINGDCLTQKASCKAMRYRPLNIWQGNGASVVVRAGESPVHGEGKQLIILIQITENV